MVYFLTQSRCNQENQQLEVSEHPNEKMENPTKATQDLKTAADYKEIGMANQYPGEKELL